MTAEKHPEFNTQDKLIYDFPRITEWLSSTPQPAPITIEFQDIWPRFGERPLVNKGDARPVSNKVFDFVYSNPLLSPYLQENSFLAQVLKQPSFLERYKTSDRNSLRQIYQQIYWDIAKGMTEEQYLQLDSELDQHPLLVKYCSYICCTWKKNRFYPQWPHRIQTIEDIGLHDYHDADFRGLALALVTTMQQYSKCRSIAEEKKVSLVFRGSSELHPFNFDNYIANEALNKN